MRIAVDIDLTLGCIITPAVGMIAAVAGIDPRDVGLSGIYAAPFAHPDPAVNALLAPTHAFWTDPALLDGVVPYPGAAAAVRLAAASGLFAGYVTRRPEERRALTADWLARGGFPDAPLEMVGHIDEARNHDVSKVDACRRLRATHLVDDHVSEVHAARAGGVEVVVVDCACGRVARDAFLAEHPGVASAADVVEAIGTLVASARMAA